MSSTTTKSGSQSTSEARSTRHARTHPRDVKAPPHWLRCDHVTDADQRCLKGTGHSDDHEFRKLENASE